jgi:hypothetical protein
MLSSRVSSVAAAGDILISITQALMMMILMESTSLEHLSPLYDHDGSAFTVPHNQMAMQPLMYIDDLSDDPTQCILFKIVQWD